MLPIAVIDGDIIMYRICFTVDPTAQVYEVTQFVKTYMTNLLNKVGSDSYIGILGIHGSNNNKYDIFPEYKRGRPTEKPPHWNIVMNILISQWGFTCISGCETDDAIKACVDKYKDCIVVSSDKDLLQIPGKHFRLGITRKGVVVKEDEFREVSKQEAMIYYYRQLLTGDSVDNVKGIDGIGPKTAMKMIPDDITSAHEAHTIVKKAYLTKDPEQGLLKLDINIILLSVNGGYAYEVGFDPPKPISWDLPQQDEEIFQY